MANSFSQIILLNKHFNGNREQFLHSGKCPVALAVQEMYPGANVVEGVFDVEVNKVKFYHEHYGIRDFLKDLENLKGEDGDVIRTLKVVTHPTLKNGK